MTASPTELTIHLREPHAKQREFLTSTAKRKVIRAGRRGGKTTGIAIFAVEKFLEGRRVLYAAPTDDQVETFWWEVKAALQEPLDAGVLYKNETKHIVEVPDTKQRIRGKTAWNADTLRGDYADILILDEFQLMAEDAWGVVGAPMLLDNNGDAVFIYTPVSLRSSGISKAKDKRHAAKMYKRAVAAQKDGSERWAAFTFTSHDNPHLSTTALAEITEDMTELAYQQEIMAEDIEDVPGALWKRRHIRHILPSSMPDLVRVGIGVDPTGGAAEAGIVAAGVDRRGLGFVIGDHSLLGSPAAWGGAVVEAYNLHEADFVAGEKNYGGEMVQHTIRSVQGGEDLYYKDVNATRGKAVRAQPISAKYERGLVFHVGEFPELEEEMCGWVPDAGMLSPNRLDALVWILTELMVKPKPGKLQDQPKKQSTWTGLADGPGPGRWKR